MHKKLDGKGHIAFWVIVKRRWGYMTFAADNELEMLFNPAQLAQWFPAQFQAAMRSQACVNAKLQAKWDSQVMAFMDSVENSDSDDVSEAWQTFSASQ